MKNNRAVRIDADFVAKHNLSTSKPPKGSLFWKLWNASTEIAESALNTDFIRGIKNGTLDPVTFGAFNISDAYYCFKGAEDYQTAVNKAVDPVLKAFLTKKYNSYIKYNDAFPDVWRIKNAEGIVPTGACIAYSEFERSVASQQEPIYALFAMLPCEYLWAWLGAQLSPPSPNNLYTAWITGNNSPKSAYAMGNFIDEYQKKHSIDESLAKANYMQAMKYELLNFLGE